MPEIGGDSEEELEQDQDLHPNQSRGTLNTDAAIINAHGNSSDSEEDSLDVPDQVASISNHWRVMFSEASAQSDESKMDAETDIKRNF